MKMPLPPLLAKKLAKRGIISSKTEKNTSYKGYEGCPNKYNIYHDCTKYCMIRWKAGVLQPSAKYIKKRDRLLKKYPLPSNWREIYDRGCGRFYYWDTKNDIVSWLSPKHPKAKLSYSAAYLREERILHSEEFSDKVDEKKKHLNEEKDVKKYSNSRYKSYLKSNHTDSNLDPMDPAAYSDVLKGTWSSGLHNKSESRSNTNPVLGPLYQIRPHYLSTSSLKKK